MQTMITSQAYLSPFIRLFSHDSKSIKVDGYTFRGSNSAVFSFVFFLSGDPAGT